MDGWQVTGHYRSARNFSEIQEYLFFVTDSYGPHLLPHRAKHIFSRKRNWCAGCGQMMKVTPTEAVMMQGTDAASFLYTSIE
jgi:hypothetical protein